MDTPLTEPVGGNLRPALKDLTRPQPGAGDHPVPFTQVIVPIDPGHLHHRELQPAAELARMVDAEVILLTVMTPGRHPDAPLERRLEEIDRGLGPLRTRTQIVEEAHVADAIVGFATSMPGSIICMASHGPGRLPENLHTTVSAPVVRTASCPVVLVGPHCDRLDPTYTSVVACVDDSPVAHDVAFGAAAWAEALGLELWLVDTVLRPDRIALQGDEPFNDAWEGGHLRNLALALGEQGANAQWEVLHDADPSHPHHAILDYVVPHPQALVVMGSHHHTPRQHLAHGSVVMQVTHHATNPIVVIPQAAEQT